MCVYAWVYSYMCVFMHMCVFTCMFMLVCLCMCVCVCVYMCVYVCMGACLCVHTCRVQRSLSELELAVSARLAGQGAPGNPLAFASQHQTDCTTISGSFYPGSEDQTQVGILAKQVCYRLSCLSNPVKHFLVFKNN